MFVVFGVTVLAFVGVGLAQLYAPLGAAGPLAQIIFLAASVGVLLGKGAPPSESWRVFFVRPATRFGWLSVALFGLGSVVAARVAGFRAEEFWSSVSAGPFLLSLVAAPVCEEVFFRGILLGAVLPLWSWSPKQPVCSPPMAVYLTAMLFLIFHLPFDMAIWQQHWAQGAIPLHIGSFFLALWTGILVVVDRSLWTPMLAHAAANAAVPLWQAWL